MRVILLIPVYNEQSTVLDVLSRAAPHAHLTVVVDDGSDDGSEEVLRSWARTRADVVYLRHGTNLGMSRALRTGFAYLSRSLAEGRLSPDDVLVTLDADGQHRPEDIPAAVQSLVERKLDVLLARRDLSSYPPIKRLGNRALTSWARLLSGFPYQDAECGFRLMRLAVVHDILPFFTGLRYGCAQELAVLTARRRFHIANDFPTSVLFYRHGARLGDGVTNMLMGAVALWRVLCQRPLRRRGPGRAEQAPTARRGARPHL